MSQEYARVSSGKFTTIRYDELELRFGNTISEILATGDEIYPIIEPLINQGTDTNPIFREPTSAEERNRVLSISSLAKPIHERDLGAPGGVATLSEMGDLNAEQVPEDLSGGAGGGELTSLYKLLRREDLTSEMIEEFSNSDEGFAAWSNLLSLPDTFLIPPLIPKIHRSPSVMIALSDNANIYQRLSPWDTSNMLSTERANTIAGYTDSKFAQWISAEEDPVGLTELSYSRTAMTTLASSQYKMNLVAHSQWFMNQVNRSNVAMQEVASSNIAFREIANSQLAIDTIIETKQSYDIMFSTLEAMQEFAASVIAPTTTLLHTETVDAMVQVRNAMAEISKNPIGSDIIFADDYLTTAMLPYPESYEEIPKYDAAVDALCNNIPNLDKVVLDLNAGGPFGASVVALDNVLRYPDAVTSLSAAAPAMTTLALDADLVRTLVADTQGIAIMALHAVATEHLFSNYVNRGIIFNEGGKRVADNFMVDSTDGRAYLLSIAESITTSSAGSTFDKMGYLMELQYTQATNPLIGDFLGDTNTGQVQFSGAINPFNERIHLTYVKWSQTSNRGTRALAVRFIPMFESEA